MGKKRKPELDLEVERTMYGSFVTAANAVSQLYTQAVQQQRRAAVSASRATLEKVVGFALRENPGGDQLSKSALLQFLQHEYEHVEDQEYVAQQAPVQMMPFMASGMAGGAAVTTSDDSQDNHHGGSNKASRHASHATSPMMRSMNVNLPYPSLQDHQQQQQQHQPQQQQQHLSSGGNPMEVVGHTPFMPPSCALPSNMHTGQNLFMPSGHNCQ